jgi:hypothetical protein
MAGGFFVHEDDWGMVALTPEENRDHYRKAFEPDRPSKSTAVDLKELSSPRGPVPLAVRKMARAELESAFAAILPAAPLQWSATLAGKREPKPNGFAFGDYRLGVYGTGRESVDELFIANGSHDAAMRGPFAAALAGLAAKHRLVLADLWSHKIVGCADARETLAWLEADDE